MPIPARARDTVRLTSSARASAVRPSLLHEGAKATKTRPDKLVFVTFVPS